MQQLTHTAWITGGGTGIGRAIALRLAREGWRVAISGRRAEPLEAVHADARELAGEILPMPVDVTDRDAMHRAAAEIREAFGTLYLCVLNAGTYFPYDARKDFDAEAFDKHYAVNFFGVINGIDAVIDPMREYHMGHIVIVSSVSGYSGLPLAAPYSSGKAALINLAESLKFDLDPLNIKTTIVNPGFVETPLTDQNKFTMPAMVSTQTAADRIVDGIHAGKFEINFPRRFTWILKFARILPYFMYFPLMRKFTGRTA
ncbi:MAG: SDR family NAD(P)-dependent oxidoreductase [Gammaproteobacteria bacterium]|nr:SDR family NAD(P)-dependent oxidoreductase [Gammaproteobacteria bacterium]